MDYRLAPEHPFPEGLTDCVAVYRGLLETFKPENIVLLGDSAGGGMTLATMLKARDEGLPMPAGVTLYAPFTDATKTGDTYYTLEGKDPLLHYEENVRFMANAYAGNADKKDPLVSPVYNDYKGFPPTLIQVGTRDILLSCSARVYRKMKNAGVSA